MFHVEPKASPIVLAKTKDYLVTGDSFEVLLDLQTQIAETVPAPSSEKLAQYYDSSEYISHGNQKRGWIDHLYAFVQRIMLKQKERWLSKYVKESKRYLDFGCGTGVLIHHLNKNNWVACGVEPSEKARDFSSVTDCLYPSLATLPQTNFDIIALWHVLEHLPDPTSSLKEFNTQLKQEGYLFLALPNFNSFDANYYKDYWAAYDVPRHLWHFSAQGINQLCDQCGFELVASKGLLFDAFYVSYLSEQHQKSKAAFIKGICVGLWSNLKACFTKEHSSKLYIFKKKA